MADANATELCRLSDSMFGKKGGLHTLWQAITDECYVERADYTKTRIDGDEYADLLVTSYPGQCRRDLANAMGALTRPKSKQWFRCTVDDVERKSHQGRSWLTRTTDKQRKLLYKLDANFQRVMQQSDNDFTTVGNAVISHIQIPNTKLVGYEVWHPRDCAWFENAQRKVVGMHRRWKLALCDWEAQGFDVPLPERYKNTRERDPAHEIDMLHVVMPTGYYDPYGKKKKFNGKPYVSVYLERGCQIIVKEGFYEEFPYTVRRWLLHANSPYAYSPAAVYGLVESRLLQAQTKVVLDAGERVVDPPMIATRDAVLGGINTYTGGTTWVDGDYDERLGSALKALDTGANIPLGVDFIQDTREILAAAWYINKLSLPDEKDMTAFEVNERISEYIRSIGPVVEPFEVDNGNILSASFTTNMRLENFGPKNEIPADIQGEDVEYEFEGPLQIAYQRIKLQQAKETWAAGAEMVESIGAIDPQGAAEIIAQYNKPKILRDSASYIGGEPDWMRPMEEILAEKQAAQEAAAAQQQQLQQAQELENANAAADLVPKVDAANQSINNIVADNDTGDDGEDEMPDIGGEPVSDDGDEEYAEDDALAALAG